MSGREAADSGLACYICSGCGIGDGLDVEALAATTQADRVRTHAFLCGEDGLRTMRADIEAGGLGHVCVAACSRRSQVGVFSFPDVVTSRVNLREGVIWACAESEPASRQQMAVDYIRMGLAGARLRELPATSVDGRVHHILVIGAGIAGITASLEAARAGYRVSLVEKSAEPGGAMRRMKARTPVSTPYADPSDTALAQRIAELGCSDRIALYLSSTVAGVAGEPGRFVVVINKAEGGRMQLAAGAIIQTSGFAAYPAQRLERFGYSANEDVITQQELEEIAINAGDGPIMRPSDGRAAASVLFVQCAGQRSDEAGELSWCSGHCCATAIKQAMYFKDQNPAIETTILATDLRVYGESGEAFHRSALRKGVRVVRGIARSIATGEQGPVVTMDDRSLGEERRVGYDLVVLATGMEPTIGRSADIEGRSHHAKASLAEGDGFIHSAVAGFSDEAAHNGIIAAGCARVPMNIAQAEEDARAAVLKAIKLIGDSAGRCGAPVLLHGPDYPRIKAAGCTRCGRCQQECPYGAIDAGDDGFPSVRESACQRCGVCIGACPEAVIDVANFPARGLREQIAAAAPSGADARILVFACEKEAYPALDMAAREGYQSTSSARVISVPCLGWVNPLWLREAFECGYDAIALLGCGQNACEPARAAGGAVFDDERLAEVRATLARFDLAPERFVLHELDIDDLGRAPQLINDLARTIDRIGPNPRGRGERESG